MAKNLLVMAAAMMVVIAISTSALAQDEVEVSGNSRSPLMYAISSFIVPGLGQLFQDELEKAAIHFGVAVAIPIAGTLATLASPVPVFVGTATGIISFGWAFLSAVDAYRIAKQFNRDLGIAYEWPYPVPI